LRDHTDRSDSSYESIEQALILIKDIASELNNRQLEYHNIHKSLELGDSFRLKNFFIPSRRLLHYFEEDNGISYKRSNGKRGILDMYVFSDLILLNRRSGFLSKQEFIFAPHSSDDNSSTQSLDISENPSEQELVLTCTFKNSSSPRVLEMYFDKNPQQYQKVKGAVEDMLNVHSQTRRSKGGSLSH